MDQQPRYNPMDESSFWSDGHSYRPQEPGTLPRGHLRNDSLLYEGRVGWDVDAASAASVVGSSTSPLPAVILLGTVGRDADMFPFTVTEEVLKRGRDRFNIYCAVCHDRVGHGQGKIPQRGYVQPPSYHLESVRSKPVGHYYRVMTYGWGAMPAFNDQVTPPDRWAIAAYIRALQASQDENFLKELERSR
jgi:mono/diheme cytochrome c family protein